VQAYRATRGRSTCSTDTAAALSNSVHPGEPGDSTCSRSASALPRDRRRLGRYRDLLLWLALPSLSSRAGLVVAVRHRARAAVAAGHAAREIDVANAAAPAADRGGARDELDDVARSFNERCSASSTRSVRCGSSAPRSPTSCARRSLPFAARSS
jgi:hypothetical protein